MPIIYSPAETSGGDGVGTPGAELHAGQLLLGDLVLGATDEHGVEWLLEGLSGWDAVGSTGSVEQRASDHGGWLSPAFYAPRLVEVSGSLLAASWDAASRALDRLWQAVPLSTLDTLYVAETERTLTALVRQEGDPLTERRGGWARFSLSLIAPDPRRYAVDVTTVETGLGSTAGGLSLPVTLPLSIAADTTSGVLVAVNGGNMGTRPTLTVHGPVDPFTITHRGGEGVSRTLRYHEAVPAGRFLVIDTDKRTALLDGTTTRRLTGTWFEYEPGDNEVVFSATSYSSTARLVSEHRNAWR